MMLRGPVLVGTDLTETADEAVRSAAQLAQVLQSRLIVCHAVPELLPDGSLFDEFRSANLAAHSSILEKARLAVQEQVEAIAGPFDVETNIVIEAGTPHVALLRQAKHSHAGVVVVWPGPVAADVVRHAGTSVLVVRRSPQGPVVGASDFSDPSLPVLHVAADEARRRSVPLHLLHALDINPFADRRPPEAALPYLQDKSWVALEGLDQLHARATQRLEDALKESGVTGRAVVEPGSAADVIVHHAETARAGLVVVGTHGRSGLALLTLGSTAASVIAQAPCSVLVIRLPGS